MTPVPRRNSFGGDPVRQDAVPLSDVGQTGPRKAKVTNLPLLSLRSRSRYLQPAAGHVMCAENWWVTHNR
jgi:hypothetical protein